MKFYSTYIWMVGLAYLVIFSLIQHFRKNRDKAAVHQWSQQIDTIYTHRFWYKLGHLCLLLGIILLFVALARPQWGEVVEKRPQVGLNILFAVDTSKSMLATDVRPNRLELAKLSIESLLQSLPGNHVGLIAFAGNAFLQCPSTADHGAFKLTLQALDTGIIPKGGTNISEAIHLAMETFDANAHYKQVILLTDGENLSGDVLKMAQEAAQHGVVVHTVGIGSPQGSHIGIKNAQGITEYLKDADGKLVMSRLDESTLQQIAQITHGFYVPLGNAGEGLQQIYNTALKQFPKENFESEERIPIERFHGFAALALLFLLLEPCCFFRKGKMRL